MKKSEFSWIDIDALTADFRARLVEKATSLDNAAKRTADRYETDRQRLVRIIETGEGDETARQNAERRLSLFFNPEERVGTKITDYLAVTGDDIMFATRAEMGRIRVKGAFVFLYTLLSWYKEFGSAPQRVGAMIAFDKIVQREQNNRDGVKWIGEAIASYEQHKSDSLIKTIVRADAAQQLTHLELFRRKELSSERATRTSFAGHAAWRARTA